LNQVRLRKLGVTVMVLMRSRFVLAHDGTYLAAAHSFTPLPSTFHCDWIDMMHDGTYLAAAHSFTPLPSTL
jgi:hypothetical protein